MDHLTTFTEKMLHNRIFGGEYQDITVWDRFSLVKRFIRQIIELDKFEMERVSYNTSGNQERIKGYIGNNRILSYEICDYIKNITDIIARSSIADMNKSEESRENWRSTQIEFEGLCNLAWQTNSEFLDDE